MKHTYKPYYFFFLVFFLLKIPQTTLATYLNKETATTDHIRHTLEAVRQEMTYTPDTVITEFTAATRGEVTKPKVGVYPNPSFGLVKLEVKEDRWQGGTVSVYNIIGQLVAQKPIDSDEIDFDLSGKSEGVYLVTLRSGDAQKTLRLVKK